MRLILDPPSAATELPAALIPSAFIIELPGWFISSSSLPTIYAGSKPGGSDFKSVIMSLESSDLFYLCFLEEEGRSESDTLLSGCASFPDTPSFNFTSLASGGGTESIRVDCDSSLIIEAAFSSWGGGCTLFPLDLLFTSGLLGGFLTALDELVPLPLWISILESSSSSKIRFLLLGSLDIPPGEDSFT